MCDKKYLEGTKIEDLIGKAFGMLKVVGFDWHRYEIDKERFDHGEISGYNTKWICKCKCGNITSVAGSSLKHGYTRSCGCYNLHVLKSNSLKIRTLSFEQWCLDNNHQDYLDLWDYELNDRSPSNVNYRSSEKYYFKCSNNKHKSELFLISRITQKNKYYNLSCKKCNSFGQYLLDTYGNLDMWSDKNDMSPFEISKMSGKKVILVCENCGRDKSIVCNSFVNRKGIGCSCDDKQSYPNKFITSFLSKICSSFKTEKTFSWSKGKRYDHYIPSLNLIIEANGMQHYDGGFARMGVGGRTLEEEQENDKLKKELALRNGIKHYIELDCRESEVEWIKNSVMNSELPKLLNFKEDDIDWIECGKFATKNLIKEVCNAWNMASYKNTNNLSSMFGLCRSTVIRYLNKGAILGWCEYNPKEESLKSITRITKILSKQLEVFDMNDNSLGVFKSCNELERISESIFGTKLNASGISLVCTGKKKTYKGFKFKYVQYSILAE